MTPDFTFCDKRHIRERDLKCKCDECTSEERRRAISEIEWLFDQWESRGGKIKLTPKPKTSGYSLRFQYRLEGKWRSMFLVLCQHTLLSREKHLHCQLQVPASDLHKSFLEGSDGQVAIRQCIEQTHQFWWTKPRKDQNIASIPLAGLVPVGLSLPQEATPYDRKEIWDAIGRLVDKF